MRGARGKDVQRLAAESLEQRFQARRQRILRDLHDPQRGHEARRRLDDLHLAYRAVRLARERPDDEAAASSNPNVVAMRRLIAASIEDGLIRCTRRRRILEEGRRRGLSDFQIHLLMAQVQFGQMDLFGDRLGRSHAASDAVARAGARLAAAGVLGFALFLSAVRWLHL